METGMLTGSTMIGLTRDDEENMARRLALTVCVNKVNPSTKSGSKPKFCLDVYRNDKPIIDS